MINTLIFGYALSVPFEYLRSRGCNILPRAARSRTCAAWRKPGLLWSRRIPSCSVTFSGVAVAQKTMHSGRRKTCAPKSAPPSRRSSWATAGPRDGECRVAASQRHTRVDVPCRPLSTALIRDAGFGPVIGLFFRWTSKGPRTSCWRR